MRNLKWCNSSLKISAVISTYNSKTKLLNGPLYFVINTITYRTSDFTQYYNVSFFAFSNVLNHHVSKFQRNNRRFKRVSTAFQYVIRLITRPYAFKRWINFLLNVYNMFITHRHQSKHLLLLFLVERLLHLDRKSTRLNSSHVAISYAVLCLKKKKNIYINLYVISLLLSFIASLHTSTYSLSLHDALPILPPFNML